MRIIPRKNRGTDTCQRLMISNRKRRIPRALLHLFIAGLTAPPAEAFVPFSLSGERSVLLQTPSVRNTCLRESLAADAVPSPAKVERKIVTLGRKGKTDEALELFRSIPDPHIRQTNAAIDACARARPVRVKDAISIVEKSFQPNVYTFGALMNALARDGRDKEAQKWLRRMQDEYNVEPNAVVYQSAINACSRASNLESALKILKDAENKSIPLTIVGYNAAMSAATKAGDADAALQIFERLKTERELPNPDAVTYGTLLSALETSRRWNELLQYARVMQEQDIPIDVLSATSMLHACQQHGLASEALEFLEIAEQSQHYRRMTAGRIQAHAQQPLEGADAVAYCLAISACSRGGAWQEAIATLDKYIEKHGTATVEVFTAAMTGCEYAGEWKQAFILLGRMRKLGVEPNEGTFTSILGACATACAKYQQEIPQPAPEMVPDAQLKALRLVSVLQKDKSVCSPNVQIYNAAIRVCAEALDVKRAFSVLNMIEADELRPNVVTFGSLMTACERVHDVGAVSVVFDKMRSLDVKPNEIICGAAISAFRKGQEAGRCFQLLRNMLREGLRPNTATFNTVMIAQIESKDLKRALQVYEMFQEQDFVSPTRQTYSILVRALLAGGEPSQAEALLRRMKGEGLVPDVELLTDTIDTYEKLGQPRKALLLMESMRQEGYDFYESSFLNVAFKQGVKAITTVDRGLRTTPLSETPINVPPLDSSEEPDLFFNSI